MISDTGKFVGDNGLSLIQLEELCETSHSLTHSLPSHLKFTK